MQPFFIGVRRMGCLLAALAVAPASAQSVQDPAAHNYPTTARVEAGLA